MQGNRKSDHRTTIVPLKEKYLEAFDERSVGSYQNDLEYPCNDSSLGVSDFSSWSYFQGGDTKIVNAGSSHLWNKQFVNRIKNQMNYSQFIPKEELTGVRRNRAQDLRQKKAKAMLARWKGQKSSSSLVGSVGDSEPDTEMNKTQNRKKKNTSPPRTRTVAKR